MATQTAITTAKEPVATWEAAPVKVAGFGEAEVVTAPLDEPVLVPAEEAPDEPEEEPDEEPVEADPEEDPEEELPEEEPGAPLKASTPFWRAVLMPAESCWARDWTSGGTLEEMAV